jgi:hypothetical protein
MWRAMSPPVEKAAMWFSRWVYGVVSPWWWLLNPYVWFGWNRYSCVGCPSGCPACAGENLCRAGSCGVRYISFAPSGPACLSSPSWVVLWGSSSPCDVHLLGSYFEWDMAPSPFFPDNFKIRITWMKNRLLSHNLKSATVSFPWHLTQNDLERPQRDLVCGHYITHIL